MLGSIVLRRRCLRLRCRSVRVAGGGDDQERFEGVAGLDLEVVSDASPAAGDVFCSCGDDSNQVDRALGLRDFGLWVVKLGGGGECEPRSNG